MQAVQAVHHRGFFDFVRDGVEIAAQHKDRGRQRLRHHGDDQRQFGVINAERGDDFEQRHHQQDPGEHIDGVEARIDRRAPFKAQFG